jgi:hypothetical protein
MEFWDEFYTEDQVCSLLRIKPSTLKSRISTGTEHPPYQELRRGVRVYPKNLFLKWVKERKVMFDVKAAS